MCRIPVGYDHMAFVWIRRRIYDLPESTRIWHVAGGGVFDPSTHRNPYMNDQECRADWSSCAAQTNRASERNGRGAAPTRAASVLGFSILPDCSYMEISRAIDGMRLSLRNRFGRRVL